MQQFFGDILKSTTGRRLYDITADLGNWVNDQPIEDGLLTLHIQHTSASILINENYDSDVLVDLENFFSRLVVDGDNHFIHTTEGPDDMPAHIRTALTQTNLSIPVHNKKILLGKWQGVFVFEHRYGNFNRKVKLHFIGS
tara:strand:+ start:2273 stop:2692 length:420 start_codon:yes stop_codon:yes gene_type:complete